MINSQIETITYPNGEIQKVQLVTFDSWTTTDFFTPEYSKGAFDQLCNIYRDFIVPKCPWIFGQLILFHVPDNFSFSGFKFDSDKYGSISDVQTAAAIILRHGVRIVCGKPVFFNSTARALYYSLQEDGYLRLVRGYLPDTAILPVSDSIGFMSKCETDALLKVNSSFFIMDRFDCATVYDKLGTPIGLCVKDGKVLNPPLYGREALVVSTDGHSHVIVPELRNLTVEIDGRSFRHGENAVIYTRPECFRTPAGNCTDIVISGTDVRAVHYGGRTPVPASGFVLRCQSGRFSPNAGVSYSGYDYIFGVQAGNSAVINGVKSEEFLSPFYSIKRPWHTPFPPSLYPLDYQNSRAPRIAIGADYNDRPMLLWAEGAGKTGYTPGLDSRGASLKDMADICQSLGMYNAVNLDGGGSAQILLNNCRSLLVSDRNVNDKSEAERAIPVGIIIRN